MTNVIWVEPALTWSASAKVSTLRTPRLLEIRSDDFMEEFLQAMRGTTPHTYLNSNQPKRTNGTVKLFQPLHGCYYLVTASLVCRQVGLPDRDVKRSVGEATGFVVRRKSGGVEEGWVNEGERRGWNAVNPLQGLVDDEELLPLNPIKVCTKKTPGLAAYRMHGNCERTIYHGYLPVGNRDKYTATPTYPATASQTNQQLVGAYLSEIYADDTSNLEDKDGGFRASEFDTRVIGPWKAYNNNLLPTQPADLARRKAAAYYIIVDLADFVKRTMPDVWAALIKFYNNLANPKAGITGNRLSLLNRLLNEDNQANWNVVNGNEIGQALYDLRAVLIDDSPFLLPVAESIPATYTLGVLPTDLKQAIINALSESLATDMQVSDEFAELVREQVRVPKPEGSVTYFLRLIYTHDPACPPVISEPSSNIAFARFFDGDAPARKVRIEAPRLQDLRKFKPGMGIQMDKDLRDVLNRVHEGMKDGEPLEGNSVSWELGMICSFSIQIVFLVALIVMFIFLILLNIVFWWLPFLKICLPIPKPK